MKPALTLSKEIAYKMKVIELEVHEEAIQSHSQPWDWKFNYREKRTNIPGNRRLEKKRSEELVSNHYGTHIENHIHYKAGVLCWTIHSGGQNRP